MKKALGILLLFTNGLICFGQEFSTAFQEQIKKAQQEHQIPAISVNLITPDTIYTFVNGKVRTTKKERITPEAKFHLGSNSKAITSFIAMHLAENNSISWDTSFFELFPELKASSDKAYATITLSDLLSHNAGIKPYTTGTALAKFNSLTGTTSEKRYAFSKAVLAETPAKTGTYSNAGYVLAALMLEKASGKTFKQRLDETMNELDLDYFIGFPNKENEMFPWGHIEENGSFIALDPNHPYKLPSYMSSAGDLAMNSADYAKFIQLNLNGLLGTDNYLTSEDYKTLHFGRASYAYGWGNIVKDGAQLSYHDGSTGTYYCHTVVFPEKKIAVVLMANTASQEAVKALYALQKTISDNPKTVIK